MARTKGPKSREVRFVIREELYDQVAEHAERYGEAVGPFVRHLLVERLSSLDSEPQGSSKALLGLFERFADLVQSNMIDSGRADEFRKSFSEMMSVAKREANL